MKNDKKLKVSLLWNESINIYWNTCKGDFFDETQSFDY